MDPLWATAGALSILTFSSINACSADEAWPLGASDSSALEWIRLGVAKMTVESGKSHATRKLFSRHDRDLRIYTSSLTSKGHRRRVELVQLCGLDDSSTQENNTYFSVAHSLSRLLEAPTGAASQGAAILVSSHMHNEFGALLGKKDPVALLLLSLWYTRARETKWWMDMRARYELPAICTYLQRYHSDNSVIQALIPGLKQG